MQRGNKTEIERRSHLLISCFDKDDEEPAKLKKPSVVTGSTSGHTVVNGHLDQT